PTALSGGAHEGRVAGGASGLARRCRPRRPGAVRGALEGAVCLGLRPGSYRARRARLPGEPPQHEAAAGLRESTDLPALLRAGGGEGVRALADAPQHPHAAHRAGRGAGQARDAAHLPVPGASQGGARAKDGQTPSLAEGGEVPHRGSRSTRTRGDSAMTIRWQTMGRRIAWLVLAGIFTWRGSARAADTGTNITFNNGRWSLSGQVGVGNGGTGADLSG